MFDLETEDKEQIQNTYGHSFTLNQIKKQYPYDDKKRFNRKRYERLPNTRLTYNPLIAMQMKLKDMPCIAWGQKASGGQRAFVFNCQNEKKVINF